MRKTILAIILLLTSLPLMAQQLPERSAVRRGNRHFNKGRYERSIEHYNRALEAAPAQFEATYDLGNALYRMERYEAAEQTLQKAAADSLRTSEERAHAYYNLGNAQFKQEKYKEALESYREALKRNPADMEAKYNYAYTKKLLDDQQQNQDQNQQQQQQGGNDQQQNQQDQQDQQNQQDQQGENKPEGGDEQEQEQPAQPQPVEGAISEQEQEQMLDAIQAQEDRTQEKLKEKQGIVIRGTKNW